jgi:hypothetical protein
MKTTSELLRLNAIVGDKLDAAAPDHAAMRFLLQARRAVRAELEARRAAAQRVVRPFRLVGMSDDGMACYED